MAESKKGLRDSEPRKDVVDASAYPERPYGEAVTDAHRAVLREHGIEVTKKTVTEQEAAVE